MSESENNRIKTQASKSNKKTFDPNRKRSSALDETQKLKIISQYMPPTKRICEDQQEGKSAKSGLDFSKLFHKKIQEPTTAPVGMELEKRGFELLLDRYEKLRMEYEAEGMSQSSIILLQRMSKQINSDPGYPNIDQVPVLQELLNISK